jgi:hypothetical protein
MNAQRIEIHGIKDFSSNSTANKAWGVGGAVDFDQFVKNTTFRANFNWTTYRSKTQATHPVYNRFSGGISAFYSLNISKKFSLQVGAEVNYTQITHTYIYDYEIIYSGTDTIGGKPLTLKQTGNFIGIGPHIGVNYELSPRFSLRLSIIPTYLISVGYKCSHKDSEPEYSKGMWVFPLQVGITYKIFKMEQ